MDHCFKVRGIILIAFLALSDFGCDSPEDALEKRVGSAESELARLKSEIRIYEHERDDALQKLDFYPAMRRLHKELETKASTP